MIRRVALWPVGKTPPYACPPSPAARKTGAEPRRWPSMDLVDALQTRHAADTWFQCATSLRGAWPRLAKPILLQPRLVAAMGLSLGVVAVDLDRPDHGHNPWKSRDQAALAVEQAIFAFDGNAVVYATRGGLRLLWVIDPPIPLDQAQSFLDQLHRDYLPQFGLPVSVDHGVKDWTRGYRTPWCPRADGKTVPWGSEAPPMDLAALTWGRTLEWRPSDALQVESAKEAVVFDWGDRKPATGTLDERIRQRVARWCEEIERASSRHDVLLKKTRSLGGLCAAHGVSPEPYVPMLVSAAGDSGDSVRTSRDGLANGAQEPWDPWGGKVSKNKVSKTTTNRVKSKLPANAAIV